MGVELTAKCKRAILLQACYHKCIVKRRIDCMEDVLCRCEFMCAMKCWFALRCTKHLKTAAVIQNPERNKNLTSSYVTLEFPSQQFTV